MMPAFILDYVWYIWIRFRDVDSSVVRCVDLIPPHTIDWPKSPYWLGLKAGLILKYVTSKGKLLYKSPFKIKVSGCTFTFDNKIGS